MAYTTPLDGCVSARLYCIHFTGIILGMDWANEMMSPIGRAHVQNEPQFSKRMLHTMYHTVHSR